MKGLTVEVSIVGPCAADFGGFPDSNTRELEVDVEVKDGTSLCGDVARYRLEMRSTKFTSGWSQPYITWGAEHLGRLQTLAEAKATVSILSRFQKYLAALPVHPQGPHEYVACILKLHKVGKARIVGYPDHKTPPDLRDAEASLGRVAHIVHERWQALLRQTRDVCETYAW